MAYTINLTDGQIFATVADGTINTSSSMVLVGKNYAGYGEFLNENVIHLLENSSNTTAPGAPLTGQLWWDSANGLMKAYNGAQWKTISSTTAQASAPSNNVTGDLWYDTVNAQLKVWTGSAWLLVGPAFTSGQGTTGAIADSITDNVAVSHVVIKLYVEDDVVGIVSKDAAFTPASSISGYTTIRPGITLSTLVGAQIPLFQGTASVAQTLEGYDPTDFLLKNVAETTTGTFAVLNNTGLSVGSNQDARIGVAGTAVTLYNQTSNGNITFNVNKAGVPTTAILINGATGGISATGTVTLGNVATGGTVSATGSVTGSQFNGSGAGLTSIPGANVTGTVPSATTAGTVTTAAQGNITSVGTLSSLSVVGSITGGTISTASIGHTGTSGVGNIGESGAAFNTVFAKSTSAQYADVAERFAADDLLEAGTVVELGGTNEITKVTDDLSENVFGVISTQAAYLMNSLAGSDTTHPAVAMTGRVPVNTIGLVRKGDRLVSAGNGLARAAQAGEATAFNVIGRSLNDKLTVEQGIVEAIVKIN